VLEVLPRHVGDRHRELVKVVERDLAEVVTRLSVAGVLPPTETVASPAAMTKNPAPLIVPSCNGVVPGGSVRRPERSSPGV
jgi:hypothetical protein